jgi:hypothetical protein
MTTVTISKNKYETLKKQASLYEKLLKPVSKQKWPLEDYSEKRIREFMRADKIDRKNASRLSGR